MDMNIQKYKAFVTTVSCGKFHESSRDSELFAVRDQPDDHDLEKEWKVILLKRSKLGVRLTSSGMKLLPYAENVCKEYESCRPKWMNCRG